MKNPDKDIQGTAVAPQATALAPQGTAATARTVASSGAAPVGNTIGSGSQADIISMKYAGRDCVMRWYKPGYGSNAEVRDNLRKLYGKGYVTDILESGVKDGREYEIMPYYPHGSAADYDFRGKDSEIITIVIKTAMSLDALHKAHIIHKDIKPANLLVTDTSSWDTVICDFGIADVTSGGKCVTKQSRTPIYAAPELYDPKNVVARVDGEDLFEITPAADFYSLGMTLLCLWYGEKAFNKKEHQLAVAKLGDGIKVPDDMPEELSEIAEGLLKKDPRKRWGFKEIREMLVPEELGEYGVRLFLNPLCDVRLNPDPGSPDYIATGKQLGKFFNDVYLWHFTGSKAPADEKLCAMVLDSFREYEDSYMFTFFDSKGDFFKEYSDWMQRCIDNDYDTKKICTSDPQQRLQISIMKTIKGLGFTPEYRFRDTGETVADPGAFNVAKADKKDALENGGLRGWLAVQYQEDPYADFSDPNSYETALADYVAAIGEIDPDCPELQRIGYAMEQQELLAAKVKRKIRRMRGRRALQAFLSIVPIVAAYFLVPFFLELAKVDPEGGTAILNHMWIFSVLGLAVGLLVLFMSGSIIAGILSFGASAFVLMMLVKLTTDYMMWVMLGLSAAVGLFALVILVMILWPDYYAISPKEVSADSDESFIESLDYTFRSDGKFDSSLNGFLTDGRMYWWEDHLKRNRICLIICYCCLALAVAGARFLPPADQNNPTADEKIEKVQ